MLLAMRLTDRQAIMLRKAKAKLSMTMAHCKKTDRQTDRQTEKYTVKQNMANMLIQAKAK